MAKFPALYEENMKALLGEEGFLAYADTFSHEYRQALRINPLKISVDDFLKRRNTQDLRPVPWCGTGFYFSEDLSVYSKHPDYAAGLYYLQEPSAMAPAAILPVSPGEKVLDLCAAPGGKSTALSARLQGKGLLVSNDISPSRAKALLKNLELMGSTRAVVLSETPYNLSRRFAGYFDKILVDAPCSGEGMFHKEPAIMKNWEQYGNAYYAKLQREILRSAWTMLRPGGMMLYSTCTFSPMEDEQMILDFIREYPDMSLLPIQKVDKMEDGHPEWTDEAAGSSLYESLRNTVRFWPHKLEGQGHFAALLVKNTEACQGKKPNGANADAVKDGRNAQLRGTRQNTDKAAGANKGRGAFSATDLTLLEAFWKENMNTGLWEFLGRDGYLAKIGTSLVFSPLPQDELKGLRVLRSGLLLGEVKKDRFEPSQALAMALGAKDCRQAIDLPADSPQISRYLKGETLQGDFREGWNLVLCDGYSLGWGKAVKGLLKNKYLKGWILGG
ncbi:MAG: RsmB/NOP family class I SAM-dependent RNA methyltransferase [Firmicutes bacterium]|nr:RsmB/NOP family class I SAM-dependent RNA methyltransferase [Bacillota bacterium]